MAKSEDKKKEEEKAPVEEKAAEGEAEEKTDEKAATADDKKADAEEEKDSKDDPEEEDDDNPKKRGAATAKEGENPDSNTAGTSRNKRSRKSASAFVPENFKVAEKPLPIIHGRGERLGDIPAVRKSVESFTTSSKEMLMAHRLLYPARGKPAKKHMREAILAFHGFLPHRPEGMDETEAEKIDEKMEVSACGYLIHIYASLYIL